MSIKFRPINPSDKERMTSGQTAVIKSSPMVRLDKAHIYPNNVVSNSIFGKADHSDDDYVKQKLYEDKYTRVGYLDLTRRVLNPFLAGRKAPVWRTILGVDEKTIMNIINGSYWYDLVENKEVNINDTHMFSAVFDIERYLFGADYLEYLLDQVDIREKLNNNLVKEFVLPCLTRVEKSMYLNGDLNIGEIVEMSKEECMEAISSGKDGWIFGKYRLDMNSSDLTPRRRSEITADLYNNLATMDVVNLKQFPTISILSTMMDGDGKESLKGQLMSYVFILPGGYRPTIDKRVDALTIQYNKLANANFELRDTLDQAQPSCHTVMTRYRNVVALVRNIFIGDDAEIKKQNLKNYKSISDSITGKEGLMRGRMQGARVDNSARTVITQDPDMPITCIGVPKKILAKVAEPAIIKGLRKYKPDNAHDGQFNNRNLATFSTTSNPKKDGITYEEYMDIWFKEKDRYGIIGRQPTLFYLGMQGFKIIPVDGDAIILSPLIVMPFNADFDGDQMHFNMPVTPAAVKEVRENMLFTNNLRYPKNGEITVVTRHEIIYGLWICKNKSEAKQGVNWDSARLQQLAKTIKIESTGLRSIIYEGVCRQAINVYDTVTVDGKQMPAGIAALHYALFGTISNGTVPEKIVAKKLTRLLDDTYGQSTTQFLNAINRMVKLGFRVAKIWPPNISTIVDDKIQKHVHNLIEEFNQNILEREELLACGLEIESQFSAYFNGEWDKLKKNVIQYLLNNLDEDNGYMSMMRSGGKGDENNILQIFGLKGRVQKNDTTAFNSIISGSYSGQLTGLEGFVSAYGSRKGIADKVLATAEPGYLSRKLEHAGSIISITKDDCGTTDGLKFTLEDVVPFLEESQISRYGCYPADGASDVEKEIFWKRSETLTQFFAAKEFIIKVLIGRYCVTNNGESVYIANKEDANVIVSRHWGYEQNNSIIPGDGTIVMRSPIHCQSPCCTKCYGRDIAAGVRTPKLGRPVGFIAAQSIGEPGTQLTMRNFQKGGVVTDSNLTSSFELIEDYFELHDLSKKRKSKKGVISYDMLSPVEGYVKEQYLGNGSKRILVTETNEPEDRTNLIPGTRKIIVHEDVKLKEYVRVGDSFQKIQGNLNIKEVLRYRGYEKAAMYLTLMLYSTFGTQDVNSVHFEVIVSAMSCAYLLSDAENVSSSDCIIPYGKGTEFKVSSIVTKPEYHYAVSEGSPVVWTLIGLKTLPKYKTDFIESLLMENMDSYIPRAILMNPNDSMTNPITRASFGLNIGIGTDIGGVK